MSRPARFGLIGAGGIARAYLEAFDYSGMAQLVGVADVRAESAAEFAKRAGCSSYSSHLELLAKAEIDAAVVCTPPATHAQVAIDLLSRGVSVLCEKPLTIDVPSAHRMLRAAAAGRAILTMASKFRYVDDVVKAKSIVDAGTIGDVVMIENSFTSSVDMKSRWNSNPGVSGGGVLIDNGTHSVDLLRYFLGALCDVQVFEGARVQALNVEDTVHIFVRNRRGAVGRCDLSWSINAEMETYLRIYGSLGTVLVGWKESKMRMAASREWTTIGKGYDKVQAFRSQLDNFARAIAGLEPLIVTAQDGLASVEVIAAAYEVMRRNRWTSVEPAVRDRVVRIASVASTGS
jgi:predicted dehydrogenase